MPGEMKRHRFRRAVFLLAFGLITLVSCLGEPEIDERWTLLELINVTPQPGQAAQANQPLDVTVTGRITYRQILTGFLVAEVRYSDTMSPADVPLDPSQNTLEAAHGIDQILANSVTAGRATRAVTGWDHLMQTIDLSFTAQVPAVTTGGYFLLLYMGDGDEIELQDGTDSLVVTPWNSDAYEVLHTGFGLEITP